MSIILRPQRRFGPRAYLLYFVMRQHCMEGRRLDTAKDHQEWLIQRLEQFDNRS